MGKISGYPIISTPALNDIVIGTDVSDLETTKNFTISGIASAIGGAFVPYVGATGNVNLGSNNITGSGFIVNSGLGTQFLKANGTLDSTVYVPATRTLTINGITYDLSANRSWTISGITSLTTTGTGGNATFNLGILNIPVYQSQGNYITQLSGEATASGPGNASVLLSNSAVTGKVLTGLNITGGSIVAADTILQAFGKLQSQLNSVVGGVEYKGTWNAATNTPSLQSSVGNQGDYYVVSNAGSTNLNGITSWSVGDWVIFNGSAWEKVDNTDSVVTVFGRTGAITAQSGDYNTDLVTEGSTNLYFTNSRARSAISSNSPALLYSNVTGQLSVAPNYVIPSLSSEVNWNNAYNNMIVSAAVTGTTTKTLTLTQQDGGTVLASWTDYDTAPVTSVFGRAGAVVAQSGDYTTTQVTEGTNLYFTNTRARQAISLTTVGSSGAATYDNTTGVLNIPNYVAGGGFVPYTGATQNVNLGEWGISSGYFQADTSPTQAGAVGRLIWNNTEGTLKLGLLGGNLSLNVGTQTFVRIVNGTGGNELVSNYKVVKIIGAQGQRMQVGLARADNDFNSKDTIGLIAENISNNNEGFIINEGLLENINTTGSLQGETWADGDTLYLSGTTFGALTNVKPAAPIHTVIIGFVAYSHVNQGKIFVKVDNGYELEELHDVSPTPYVNNGVLYRDTTTNLWKSATISTLLGYTPTGGSGTAQYLSVFTGANTVGNSILYQDGTKLGVNTSTFSYTISGTGSIELNGSSRAILGLKVGNAAKGYILHAGTDMEIANTAAGNLDFNTNSTTRGRIDASGVWKIYDLIGSGNRVVIASSSGTLSAVPASTLGLGTVTSVDMSVPTGFAIANNPVTTSGTLALSFASGYSLPTTASQSNWNTAYNDSIVSAAVTGTTTKTLTLTQQDGGTVTASWTDFDTAPVTSVFGRTGAVVAQSGDYTTTQVTEGTNLYYTDTRARQAITLTTNGASGAATYSNVTGILNIPNYSLDLSAVAQDIIPLFSGVYDLGTATKKWHELYLANAIYLGGSASIVVDIDNDIVINTNLIVQDVISATTGDFGNVTITNNAITHTGTGYSCLTITTNCLDITGSLSVDKGISVVGNSDISGKLSVVGDINITGNYLINGVTLNPSPYITGSGLYSIVAYNPTIPNAASGNYAVVIGGTNCSASGLSSISGGSNALASGAYSIVLGSNNARALGESSVSIGTQSKADALNAVAIGGGIAQGNATIAIGLGKATGAGSIAISAHPSVEAIGVNSLVIGGNTASKATAENSLVLNGLNCDAGGVFSIASGRHAKTRLLAQRAHSGASITGSFDTSVGQEVDFVLQTRTTSGASSNLWLGGEPSGGGGWVNGQYLTVASGTAMFLTITIAGISQSGTEGAHYVRKVGIKNVGGTTSLIGAVSTIGTDVTGTGTSVTITADDTNDAIAISVVATPSYRWVAYAEGVEITYE